MHIPHEFPIHMHWWCAHKQRQEDTYSQLAKREHRPTQKLMIACSWVHFIFHSIFYPKRPNYGTNCYMIHQAYLAGAWQRGICTLVFACSRRGALRPSWEAPNCPGSSDRLPERPCPSLTTSRPMCTASQSGRRFPGRTQCTGALCLKCQNAKVILIRSAIKKQKNKDYPRVENKHMGGGVVTNVWGVSVKKHLWWHHKGPFFLCVLAHCFPGWLRTRFKIWRILKG